MSKIRIGAALAVLTLLVVSPVRAQSLADQAQQLATQPEPPWPPPGVVRPGPGVKLPRVLRDVKPYYPPEAMRQKIEGTVVVECVVETDGSVKQVKVTRSLDKTYGLDDEAVKVAKQWQFAPGMKDGYAVPVLVTIEFSFSLGKGHGAATGLRPLPLRLPGRTPGP